MGCEGGQSAPWQIPPENSAASSTEIAGVKQVLTALPCRPTKSRGWCLPWACSSTAQSATMEKGVRCSLQPSTQSQRIKDEQRTEGYSNSGVSVL